jgi:hypothetical protein
MRTKETKVESFRIDQLCDVAGCDGIMALPKGPFVVLDSMPPSYPMECTTCGAPGSASGSPYPRIVHRDAP